MFGIHIIIGLFTLNDGNVRSCGDGICSSAMSVLPRCNSNLLCRVNHINNEEVTSVVALPAKAVVSQKVKRYVLSARDCCNCVLQQSGKKGEISHFSSL